MATPRSVKDEAAIREVEAAYDAAWQAGDVERLLAYLSEDAVLINPHGQVARGRPEIRRELKAVLAGPARGSTHTSLVLGVEFVTAEVAIVDGEARIEAMGREAHATTSAHRFTDILVKQNNAWMIAHIRACPGRSTPGYSSNRAEP